MLAATESADRRTDLLAEVAIVAEEITNDSPKAIQYYERILEIEPGHEQAIFALDKLYATHERWQNLADLLRRRIELSAGYDAADDAMAERFVRVESPAGEHHVADETVAAHLVEHAHASGIGDDSVSELGEHEACIICGDADVAQQGPLERAADRPAVDRHDHRPEENSDKECRRCLCIIGRRVQCWNKCIVFF